MYKTLNIVPISNINVIKKLISNIPKNISNSPIKLQVPGNPTLAKQKINKYTEKIGIT